MEKRVLTTIIVCFAVIWVYTKIFVPSPPARRPGNPPATQGPPPPSREPGQVNSDRITRAPATPPADVPVFEVREHILESGRLRLVLDSRGACVTSAFLVDYREDLRPGEVDERPLALFSPELDAGGALQIFVTEYPFLETIPWDMTVEESEVIFSLPLGDRSVIKKIRLDPDSYTVEVSVRFDGEWPLAGDDAYTLFGPQRIRFDGRAMAPNGQVIGTAGPQGNFAEVERKKIRPIPGGEHQDARRVLWNALESQYFAFVLRPLLTTASPQFPWSATVQGLSSSPPKGMVQENQKRGVQGLPFRIGIRHELIPGNQDEYQVFLGPKDRRVLALYKEVGFGELIDYGSVLGPLLRLFTMLLGFFEGIFGSYGIAIICLTILVKALLHPLNKKNQAVMQKQQKKMAKIQPQMKEIKERYKDNSLKANKEIQKLMKEHDVNPAQMAGGCMLMFLQLPVWIGLYWTFILALDLRHAPFLYIDDLARPDRLFPLPTIPILGWDSFNLLPVLYVVVTVLNQRMMPKSPDPQMQQQQKMMNFMMVFFGFIFYNFASGLLLYFLTSSTLGIVEQRIIRAELRRSGDA